MPPTIQQLHKSYWWGCKYLDRLYRTISINGKKLGVVSEYNTICPFTLFYGGRAYPSGYKSTEFETHQYVHSCTLDYMVVTKLQFKEPVNCSIWVSYDRQRIKNGSFTMRKYLSERLDFDEPAFWSIERNNVDVSLASEYYTIIVPGPCPAPSGTTFGPFSLHLEGVTAKGSSWARVWQRVSVLPDTEYVFSFDASLLKFPYDRLKVRLAGYDLEGNYVGDLVHISLPMLATCGWEYFEQRFRTPSDVHEAEVIIEVTEGPPPSEEEWWVVLFDNFYLAESPRNLSPYNRVLAQLEAYDGDLPGSIYFNGEKIWEDVTRENVPRTVLERSVDLYGMPSFRSAIRHGVQNCKFFYENTSIHSDWMTRAEMLQRTRDAWGFTCDIYHPLFRASDGYADNFLFDADLVFHDCDVWSSIPVTATFYPYWSKVCINKQAALDGLIIMNPYYPALLAIHLMNKYNDPFVKVYSIYSVPETVGMVSAYDLLFKRLNLVTTDIWLDPTIDRIDPDKGWHRGSGVYSIYAAACVMAALAEIGYGFASYIPAEDAQKARDYADRIAYTLLKNQWGFPFEGDQPFIGRHEDFGDLSLPEATGGFLVLTIYDDEGNPIATSRKGWLTEFTDMFGMSPETPQVLPVNQETTWVCLRALQIYEWYKYKGGENKGAFPTILMPADVNGDGKVDVEDLKLVAQTIEKGEYCSLADINGDGKVDMEDFNLIKQALRTPMKGVFWWPTLSSEVQVSTFL